MADGPAHCTGGVSVGIRSLWVIYSRSSLALVLEYFSPLWRECIVRHAEGRDPESQMLLPQTWLRLVISPLLHSPSPQPPTPAPLRVHFPGCWLGHSQLCPASHPLLLGSSEAADPTDVWIGGSQEVRRGWERHGTAWETGQEAREGWGLCAPGNVLLSLKSFW